MHHWPWRAVIIGAVLTVLIYSAHRPDPELSGLMLAGPESLIESLSSSREAVRRAAAGRLLSLGAPAVGSLTAAAERSSDEQLDEIFLVLEDMYLSPDEALSDAAEAAMERLANSPRGELRRNAGDLLQSNFGRRQLRAYGKIESFSGKLITSMTGRRGGDHLVPDLVVIGADWTGGDEGLKYVRRLRGLAMVHLASDAPISPEAAIRLRQVITVRSETDTCLGIEWSHGAPNRLYVSWIMPGSPADVAGLRLYDEIHGLDDRPIASSAELARLTQILAAHRPGDVVPMDIHRDGRPLTIAVRLGTDFGTGRCRCAEDPEGPVSAVDALPVTLPGSRSRPLPRSDRVFAPASQGAGKLLQLPPNIPHSGH